MAKNALVRLFKPDPSARLEKLRQKLDAEEARLASLERERGILAGEVHAGDSDRRELDRLNSTVAKAEATVAELRSALAAAQDEAESQAAEERQRAEAEKTARIVALGDERFNLAEAMDGDVKALIARQVRIYEISAEIRAIRGTGQHIDEIDPGRFIALVNRAIDDGIAAALNPTKLPPAPLAAALATGEQIAEMSTRVSRKPEPQYAWLTDEQGRRQVRVR